MKNGIETIEREVMNVAREMRSMTRLADVESSLLPILRDHFDASLVVFYLFGKGPLEILHFGGLSHLQDDIHKFHSSAIAARWLKRASLAGPILRDRCGMTAEEFEASPFRMVTMNNGMYHARGLMLSAKGDPLGMVAVFRSNRQPAFDKDYDALLLTYAAPVSDLLERLVSSRDLSGQSLPLDTLNHLEEGMSFFDSELRLLHANDAGWAHLKRVSRKEGSWIAMPSNLLRQLRLVRELDRGPDHWSSKPSFAPVLLQDDYGTEIRFRTFSGVHNERRYYYTISSLVRTLPAASIDQVAKRMGLTPREREVCAHLVEGKRNRDIANAFGITEHTVKIHVRRVLGKFRVRSRSEIPGAVLKALTRWENEPSSDYQ